MKLLRWLDEHFEEVLLMALLVMLVVIMGLQVFMRYAVGSSLSWPEEISRYCFVWFAFLGMSYAIRTNTNLKIELLQILFPKMVNPLACISDAIYALFCLMMLKPSFTTLMVLCNSHQNSPAVGIPMWLVYLSLFVGLCLSLLRLAQKYLMPLLVKKHATTGGRS